MSETRERVFVSIAVSNPDGGLAPLPGAITASERMAAWAEANGYIPLLINDALYPAVTIDLLRDKITATIEEVTSRAALRRLVIFFAGHGASLGIDDQNWLLSKWKQRSSEVVNIASLLRVLEYHGPQQVAIIGDACQEFSATFMEVVGGPILDTTEEQKQDFELDKFFPVDAGCKAFMIKAKDGERAFCLFSEVMLDALEGDAPEQYFEEDADGRHVTSQKIAQFLKDHLASQAGKYGVSMSPRPRPGFWSDRKYFTAPRAGRPPEGMVPRGTFPARNKALGGGNAGGLDAALPRAVERIDLALAPPATAPARDLATTLETQRREVEMAYAEAADGDVRDHFETGCGICFTGAPVGNVRTSRGEVSQDWLPSNWFRLQLSDDRDPLLWADVVVNLADGSAASACVVQNFITAMHAFADGGLNVLHRPLFADARESKDIVALLAKLHAGTLTEGEIVDAASMLRYGKHRVITLGPVAAQFYDSVRDTNGLRSIAAFYAQAGQPIPLDILLYGGGRLFVQGDTLVADVPATGDRAPRSAIERERGYTYQATPAVTQHPVAGRVPWMRQAWSALATAECDPTAESWRQEALAVLPHLAAGPFTKVRPTGAEALAMLAGVTENREDPKPALAHA
ncbi:hypothetical protein ACFOKI_07210 [Sphingomonas qilianensis]|uniref:Caspase domain-containing protein n=3 Tax=Sphingomonas qilianensis TaxID=1736690 RepID=A0ABU9XQS7_9SPHN